MIYTHRLFLIRDKLSKWELRDWIEHIVPNLMRTGKLPGLSIAVVDNGETIYADGFGSRDRERNLPATPDTLYGIGSITKLSGSNN